MLDPVFLSESDYAVTQVTDADGTIVRSVIETINGYARIPPAAIEVARKGAIQADAQTQHDENDRNDFVDGQALIENHD